MAHALARGLPSALRAGSLVLKKGAECPAKWAPVATLVHANGGKLDYAKPWNYKKYPFSMAKGNLWPALSFLDYTRKRLNANSKLIVVEGSLATGKNEFAQKLAKEFDLLYVPSVLDDLALLHPKNFDLRDLNGFVPETQHFYDLEKFYADPNPKARATHMTYLQQYFFMRRLYNYSQAIVHIFNTGQGVVLTSSPFGDDAHNHALNQMGLLHEDYIKWQADGMDAINEALKPHATIYLDSPVYVVRERIKARNDPREVNSRVLSDQYLQDIEDGFKTKALPNLEKTGEVLEVEWGTKWDEEKFQWAVSELTELEFDHTTEKYKNWDLSWPMMGYVRYSFEVMGTELLECYSRYIPEVFHLHPALYAKSGWSKEMGDNVYMKF